MLPSPPGAAGARLTALTTTVPGFAVGCGVLALLLGRSPGQALALGLLVPLCLSTAAALVVAALLVRSRLRCRRSAAGEPAAAGQVDPAPSTRRRLAEDQVASEQTRLLRAVELGAGDTELMRHALALHEARLRLARVLLVEDGDLPQTLKDELVVAHRGTSAWLRARTR